MNATGLALYATYAAQAALGLVLVAIFAYFQRAYASDHLRDWTWAFLASCIYFVLAAKAAQLAIDRASLAERLPWSALSQVAAYSHVALLIRGALGISRRGRPPPARPWWILGACGLGLVFALAFALSPDAAQERLVLRVGLRFGITALALVVVAAILLHRTSQVRGIGARFTALAFASYGALQLLQLGVFIWQLTAGKGLPGSEMLGLFDLVAQASVGFALIIWVADDERRRADAASSQAERMSKFDSTTGFSNRSHAIAIIAEAIDSGSSDSSPLALLVVDVPDLDFIRTSHGIECVECVAVDIARELEASLAGGGAGLARFEARRFAAWLQWSAPLDVLTARLDALVEILERPRLVGEQRLSLRVKVGVATARAQSGGSTDRAAALARQAELAAESASDRIAFHAPELDSQARRHLARIAEVEAALEHGQFVAHYQPVVAVRTHEVVGFELLARWRRSGGELIMPAEFLPVMDERGLTLALDRQLVREGCAWLCGAVQLSGCTLSLNVSPSAFENADEMGYVTRAIAASGIEPWRLQIEITEAIALRDPARTSRVLGPLRDLGIRVALDDFGTGFSSLAQLRELPVDTIKIDRSFVHAATSDGKSLAIVRAITELARTLDLAVVAEGVERLSQVEQLEALGVTHLQGYYFARAVDPDHAIRALAKKLPLASPPT